MGLRVRWKPVGKGALVLLAGFVALQLIPELLKPPPPEPLPADVGLPRVVAKPAELEKRLPKRRLGRVARRGGALTGRRPVFRPKRDLGRQVAPRRKTQPRPSTPTPRQDPPAEAIVPPPPPPPPPEPPGDGSAEFAPH